MKRVLLLTIGGAVALLGGMAAPVSASDSTNSTAIVESAGRDGGRVVHTAEVESAVTPGPLEPLPTTAKPLALIAVIGAGALGTALFLRFRAARPRAA